MKAGAVIGILLLSAGLKISHAQETPLKSLGGAPHLLKLYQSYPQLHEKLDRYAEMQGFKGSTERLSTIIHELIHIDSASQQGYVISGRAYAPYGRVNAWPQFNFDDFRRAREASRLIQIKADTETAVYSLYVARTPNNTLANIADELNAYSQTANWLCSQVYGAERIKTIESMRDMLLLANAYLLGMNVSARTQYLAFYNEQKEARNLLALTVVNTQTALKSCNAEIKPGYLGELDHLVLISKKEAGNR